MPGKSGPRLYLTLPAPFMGLSWLSSRFSVLPEPWSEDETEVGAGRIWFGQFRSNNIRIPIGSAICRWLCDFERPLIAILFALTIGATSLRVPFATPGVP